MAALRFEVQGWIRGRAAIVVEHVTRMHPDMAPDWPQPKGAGGYRITVEGSPSYTVDFEMMGEDGDHNTGGLVATGMRILNAIPAVCAAPPGVLSTLDLPLVTGRGLLSWRAQLSVASSGAWASSDARPRWRRRTSRHRFSGVAVDTSPTSASTTSQSSRASSLSS